MNALTLTLFVSLGLAALAVIAFLWGVGRAEHEHGTRLSLLPLDDDEPPDPELDPDDRSVT